MSFYNPGNWVAAGMDFDSTSDALRFRSNNGSTNLNRTNMVIQRLTGNVGIGTTSPLVQLNVVGRIAAMTGSIWDHIAFSGSNSASYIDVGNANDLRMRINSGTNDGPNTAVYNDIMTLKSGGNVGIVTTCSSYVGGSSCAATCTGTKRATGGGCEYSSSWSATNMTSKQSKTSEDPVSEVRRIRDAHVRKFNYDLRAIFADFLRFERERNLKTVTLPIKRIGPTGS